MRGLAEHIGFHTLWNAPRDIHLIISLRCIRLAGFGAFSLILVQYLKSTGINETQIGLLLTLTMVGDLIFSFFLALISDSVGRRKAILLSSLLITLSGIALYYSTNIYIIGLIMIFGIVTPSGGEVGPFRSIEQSAISTLCRYEDRSDIFSWYTFSGGLSSGVGNFAIGYLAKTYGYGLCFLLYSASGIILFVVSLFLSQDIELSNDKAYRKIDDISETSSLIVNNAEVEEASSNRPEEKSVFDYLLPKFKPESLRSLLYLTFFLCLDALGLSLSSKSWMVYYFKTSFHLSSDNLGLLFGTASVFGAISALVGTFFCKRYGPVKTVITIHTFSSILLSFHSLPIGITPLVILFLVRAVVRSMDLPSKHVFISSTVEPQERTTAIAFINASKTLVTTIGPTVSGYFASIGYLWACFLVAGFLRLSYSVGLFARFWNHEPKN